MTHAGELMADMQGDKSHLVVIGASAGGIESLEALVGTIPSSFSAPIVIAQHLSPRRESALGEILARRSRCGSSPIGIYSNRA